MTPQPTPGGAIDPMQYFRSLAPGGQRQFRSYLTQHPSQSFGGGSAAPQPVMTNGVVSPSNMAAWRAGGGATGGGGGMTGRDLLAQIMMAFRGYQGMRPGSGGPGSYTTSGRFGGGGSGSSAFGGGGLY
jgi:hypothetical protein